METAARILERLALAVLLVGGVGMLMSVFLGTADVIGTQGFGSPVAGARELTESTMVLIVFGALAYAQIRRKHIRVELIYEHMPPRIKAVMDVLADIAGLVFFGLLLWQAIGEALFSMEIGAVTDGLIEFPLTPARFILAIGTGLMMLRLVLDLAVDARRIATGEEIVMDFDPIVTGLDIPGPEKP
ncbi:MAG: TRAP transporter small permease [Proteobacteria bacterium]|nr:TRAP transporter small permease [Pseudomonadota bacterium]